MLTQTILCSLTTGKPDEPIFCRYGEKGRQIKFGLINPITDFTGYDATFYLFKPDGNFVVEDLTIDNSGEYATLTLDENMTSASGRGVWDIKLSQTNVVVYTFNGEILIDKPTVTDELITSVSAVNGYAFPDDFQKKLIAGDGITINEETNVISAEGEKYYAGEYVGISNTNTIDLKQNILNTINGKQDELTAGLGITINNNTIRTDFKMDFVTLPVTNLTSLNGNTFGDFDFDYNVGNKTIRGFIPKYLGNPYFVLTNVFIDEDNNLRLTVFNNFTYSSEILHAVEGILIYDYSS